MDRQFITKDRLILALATALAEASRDLEQYFLENLRIREVDETDATSFDFNWVAYIDDDSSYDLEITSHSKFIGKKYTLIWPCSACQGILDSPKGASRHDYLNETRKEFIIGKDIYQFSFSCSVCRQGWTLIKEKNSKSWYATFADLDFFDSLGLIAEVS